MRRLLVVVLVAFAGAAAVSAAPEQPAGSIAFSAEPPRSSGNQIFVLDIDTGGVRQITRGGGYDPSWSPDGSRIAFERTSAGPCNSDACSRIWVTSRNGGTARPITPANRRAESPAWSPTDDRIAYVQWRPSKTLDNVTDLYVRMPDGATLRLTHSGGNDSFPVWSPDGKQLAFTRYAGSKGPYVYVMNADGANVHRLATRSAWVSAWSPDGKQLAVSRAGGTFDNVTSVSLIDLDGTHERPLLRGGGDPEFAPSGGWVAYVPDDQDIAVGTIGAFRTDGAPQRQLLRGRFTDPSHVDWAGG